MLSFKIAERFIMQHYVVMSQFNLIKTKSWEYRCRTKDIVAMCNAAMYFMVKDCERNIVEFGLLKYCLLVKMSALTKNL